MSTVPSSPPPENASTSSPTPSATSSLALDFPLEDGQDSSNDKGTTRQIDITDQAWHAFSRGVAISIMAEEFKKDTNHLGLFSRANCDKSPHKLHDLYAVSSGLGSVRCVSCWLESFIRSDDASVKMSPDVIKRLVLSGTPLPTKEREFFNTLLGDTRYLIYVPILDEVRAACGDAPLAARGEVPAEVVKVLDDVAAQQAQRTALANRLHQEIHKLHLSLPVVESADSTPGSPQQSDEDESDDSGDYPTGEGLPDIITCRKCGELAIDATEENAFASLELVEAPWTAEEGPAVLAEILENIDTTEYSPEIIAEFRVYLQRRFIAFNDAVRNVMVDSDSWSDSGDPNVSNTVCQSCAGEVFKENVFLWWVKLRSGVPAPESPEASNEDDASSESTAEAAEGDHAAPEAGSESQSGSDGDAPVESGERSIESSVESSESVDQEFADGVFAALGQDVQDGVNTEEVEGGGESGGSDGSVDAATVEEEDDDQDSTGDESNEDDNEEE